MEEPDFWDDPEKSQEIHEKVKEHERRYRQYMPSLEDEFEEIETADRDGSMRKMIRISDTGDSGASG